MRISAWTLLLTLAVPGLAQAATLELVSGATGPVPDSLGHNIQPVLSDDGRYVAFLSYAPNLSPGQEDDNGVLDVFLHDRVLGTTTLVSHAAGSPTRAASPGLDPFKFAADTHFHGDTRFLDISADGRYVAFITAGVELVPPTAGSGQTFNVFLWDRVTGTTTLASHAAGSTGTAAGDSSFNVRISADGNFLAFNSLASNLVAGQTENTHLSGPTADVFLWSRASDTITLVSRRSGTTAGTPSTVGNQPSFAPVLSADGGVVVFTTLATDLLPTVIDANGAAEVYAYQRSTDTLSLVSRSASAPQPAAGAWPEGHAISADGRYVAFISHSAYLVPGQVDDVAYLDAFLYDRATGEMRLVSHRSLSPLLAGGVFVNPPGLAMSADGRYVAFSSEATDLAPGQVDTNQYADVFVYDRDTGLVALASHRHDSAATAGSGFSGAPGLSADGRFLVFRSQSGDLVPGQTEIPTAPGFGGTDDVFLYDRTSRSATLVSRTRASASAAGNGNSFAPVLSANGGVAAFLSTATDLGEGQTDPYGHADLFLYHRTSGEIASASLRDPGLPPPLTSLFPSILGGLSADGRSVVFQSLSKIFLRDTVADTTIRLSPPLSPYETNWNPVLSADGRFVAFLSHASYLGDVAGLFLYDRAAGTFTLVNHAPGSPTQIDGVASSFALSADGRWVAYECAGCGLVPGHPSYAYFHEIFLYDRLSGENILVSHASSSPTDQPDGYSYSPAISADGRYVAFWSSATNLFPGQVDSFRTQDLFVFDRHTGAASLVTYTPGSPSTAAGLPDTPSFSVPVDLSADGRFIAFQSALPNLVPGQVDANAGADVFLHDQFAGTAHNTVLVSHAASSPVIAGNAVSAGNAPSFPSGLVDGTVSMSADGRFIAYASLATDLVAGAGDTNGAQDVFLYDRLTGKSSLVSHDGSAPLTAANGASGIPRISAEGNRVAFLSTAADLLPNETVPTGWHNIYVQDRNPRSQAGTTTFIERAFRNPLPSGDVDGDLAFLTQISADGRRIAFNSEAQLVPGDYNVLRDVYLWKDDGGTLPLPACKLLDTRRRADRPVLTSNAQRIFLVRGACGVPDTARRVVVKVTAFNPSGKGNLRFYPGAVTANPSAILRFERGTTRTETFTLPLGANGTLTILPFVAGRGTVHVAVEVGGYAE